MHHRFLIGVVALGLAIMLTPTAPITVKIEREPDRVPISIQVADIQLTDLPLAWQKLAKCESNGRLNAVSGTRKQFQGAFQIEFPRTWVAHGGKSGTPTKDATLREQFHVALHIYADRGWKPWPYCGKFLKEEYGR
jgi:hypothetical protein